MDEETIQRRIYFINFVESLEMIFSQYKETCEVLLDYQKIGGENIKDFVKNPLGMFFMPTLIYISEGWLLNSQEIEWNTLQNLSHIVPTWIFMTKVGITEFSIRSQIKEGSQQLITSKYSKRKVFVSFSKKKIFWG